LLRPQLDEAVQQLDAARQQAQAQQPQQPQRQHEHAA
jgi:hypothetical protein